MKSKRASVQIYGIMLGLTIIILALALAPVGKIHRRHNERNSWRYSWDELSSGSISKLLIKLRVLL